MTSPSKDDIIENYGYTAVERNVEPLIQKLKDEGKINANPVFVKDIEMANTPLVKKVMEFAQHELPIEVFNHSMRVYYYGKPDIEYSSLNILALYFHPFPGKKKEQETIKLRDISHHTHIFRISRRCYLSTSPNPPSHSLILARTTNLPRNVPAHLPPPRPRLHTQKSRGYTYVLRILRWFPRQQNSRRVRRAHPSNGKRRRSNHPASRPRTADHGGGHGWGDDYPHRSSDSTRYDL